MNPGPKLELVQGGVTRLHAGDWVRGFNGLIYHHGIAEIELGRLLMIHLSGPAQKDIKNAAVRITDWATFASGSRFIQRVLPASALPPAQVVERARSKIGTHGYDLLFHNCEHFASWCKTGQHASAQVQGGMVVAGVMAFVGIGIAATTGT